MTLPRIKSSRSRKVRYGQEDVVSFDVALTIAPAATLAMPFVLVCLPGGQAGAFLPC